MEAACSTYVIPDGYTAIAGEIHGSDLWLSYSGARWDGVLGDDLSSMSGTFSDTRGSGVWRAQKVSSAHPCATYEVYGGDQYLPCGGVEGYTPEANGYTFLGSATTTQTFPGTYSYYVVLTRDYNVIHLDTVEDAAGNHYGSLSTGNTADHTNIGGVADGQYATVGAGRVSGGGYVDIDASAVRPASITVVLVP
jgi:threonine dehydrogenase-like Zn-dependent dehydrogenase